MVAMEVISALQIEDGFDGDLAVQCALLHDVIEDAGKSYEDLDKVFGKKVAEGVLALTKSNMIKSKPEKMADSLARIKGQPREIGMVKLADRIVNLQPPPSYWSAEKRAKYREEAIRIHEALKGSSSFLADRLLKKISEYQGYVYAHSDLPNRSLIVSSMLAKVNGFDITSSTEVLFLEKTVSFPAPVMITTGVRGELFLTLQAKATPSIPGIS
jgi:hypothetical protein